MTLMDKLRRLFRPEPSRATVSDAPTTEAPPQPRATVTAELVPPPSAPERENRYLSAAEATELLVPADDGELPVRIRDGFFEHVPSGKRVPPASRALNSHGLVSFRVRGDAYYQSKSANTQAGQRAHLVREPDNKHDPNAVAVYALDRSGERAKVGYVNKGLARRLAKRLDAGESVDAWFMRGDPPGRDEAGVAVVLVDEEGIGRLLGP